MREPRIQTELELNEQQRERLQETKDPFIDAPAPGQSPAEFETRRIRSFEERLALADEAVESLLTSEQLVRLKQLAFRAEIGQRGLGDALAGGRLADAVGVYENQSSAVVRRSLNISKQTEDKILDVSNASEERIISEFPPEQRDKLRKLLGAYFDYESLSPGQILLRRVKQKFEAAAATRNNPSNK